MNIFKNRSLVMGLCCILMTAGVVEDATFRIILLSIAMVVGVVLAFDVLKRANA